MRNIPILLTLLMAATAVASVASAAAPAPRDTVAAAALYRRALGELALDTIDSRRAALRDLERATLLHPGQAAYELALARGYYRCGFLKMARQRYERVTRIDADDAGGHYGLGQVWRRDWLKYLDRTSLDQAVAQFSLAARLDSSDADAWIRLVPLLLEQGRTEAAANAAGIAMARDPRRSDAQLAVAQTDYRLGRLHEADSLYDAAIPHLPRSVRERFEDISPVASERDTAVLNHLPARERAAFVERFWRTNDPDLTTPENEARLEYRARVTQAYFLFFDAHRDEWDERGEVYVRYGPPDSSDYNPVGSSLSVMYSTGPAYPANLLVWSYRDLGMTVQLQDRLLSEYYLLPMSASQSMDPTPDAATLAERGDALATAGGRGVFHLLPPGVRPLPAQARVARFEGDAGPRLLGQLEAPGGPADSLWADWAVVDSAGQVRRRATGALSPSACDPTTRQVGDFAAELEPGDYTVGVTVRDARGHRGVLREAVRLAARPAALHLSDLVVACGTPTGGSGTSVRIEPNPAAEVSGNGPLSVYFEIYGLAPGAAGLARFEYVYAVRSLAKDQRFWLQKFLDPHPLPAFSVTREEQNAGPMRRQFLSVPLAALPAGRYRLEVKVRDLATGAEASVNAEFAKAS